MAPRDRPAPAWAVVAGIDSEESSSHHPESPAAVTGGIAAGGFVGRRLASELGLAAAGPEGAREGADPATATRAGRSGSGPRPRDDDDGAGSVAAAPDGPDRAGIVKTPRQLVHRPCFPASVRVQAVAVPAGRTVEDDLPAIRRTHRRGWRRWRSRCGPGSRSCWRRLPSGRRRAGGSRCRCRNPEDRLARLAPPALPRQVGGELVGVPAFRASESDVGHRAHSRRRDLGPSPLVSSRCPVARSPRGTPRSTYVNKRRDSRRQNFSRGERHGAWPARGKAGPGARRALLRLLRRGHGARPVGAGSPSRQSAVPRPRSRSKRPGEGRSIFVVLAIPGGRPPGVFIGGSDDAWPFIGRLVPRNSPAT